MSSSNQTTGRSSGQTTGVYRHEARQAVVRELNIKRPTLREVDFTDVLLSEQAMLILGQMSGMILSQYVPHPSRIGGMLDDIFETFGEEAYWVEETGHLVICVHIQGDNHFIQVPRKHWMLKPDESAYH